MGCTTRQSKSECLVHLGRSPREDPLCSGQVPTAKTTTLNPAYDHQKKLAKRAAIRRPHQLQIAATAEIREQLRKWAISLDAEAARRVTTEQLHVCGREDRQPLTRAA